METDMSLTFIVGSAGSGKSHLLYERLTNNASKYENRNEDYIALVPEQYSMEAQREILLASDRHGSFNTEVVSFQRLAFGIFEELGMTDIKVMDDLGKTLVVRKVLENCKKDLKYYHNKANMPGFVDRAKTLITELKQYNYRTQDLEKMIDDVKGHNILRNKLIDTKTIAQEFDNYINEKMITMEEVLSIFCNVMEKSEKIRKTHIYIDGFTGFTPIQYMVLEKLIKYSREVTVAITLPENEADFNGYNDRELFALSKETIVKLRELAIRNSVEIKNTVIVNKGKRPIRIADNDELCYLEENIFRNKVVKPYDKECKNLEMHVTSNPKEEARWIANEISKLMITGNYKYKDIAVVVSDMEGYYRFIQDEFRKSGIPNFIDYKRDISKNPFIDGIVAAIEVVEKDFSYESLFRFLKLGIVDIDREDIDIIENYVLQSGRRGFNSYNRKWEKQYKNISEKELENINLIREKIIEMFSDLRNGLKIKNADITDFTKCIYKFILDNDWQLKIQKHKVECDEAGRMDEAKEYEQIYETIIEMLNKLVEFLGDEIVSVKEFRQIVESGFASQKVGIIPPGLDTVMVGDLERTRLKDIKKIIFFAGVNDGLVPSANSGSGIITDMEREFLRSANYVLAPTAKENIYIERLYLYALFAKPTGKIYFSYSTSGTDGEVLRKSYILSLIKRMFPSIKEIKESSKENVPGDITNITEALEFITNRMQENKSLDGDNETKQMIANLVKNREVENAVKMIIEGIYYTSRHPKLLPEIARGLYGNRHNIGITRLERYAACAYSQFLANGLRLSERRKFEIAAYDIGNLYHYSLELFCRKLRNKNLNWRNLTDEDIQKLVEECVNIVFEEYENNAISSDARNKYIANKILKTTINTTEILKSHINAGKFEPAYYESVVEHGKVDRVDLYEDPDDGKVYVKIIDYKSGSKKFEISSTFFGTQMQLLIYLGDVIKREQEKYKDKQVLPAGAFYYEIKDPYTNGLTKAEKNKIMKDGSLTKEELKERIACEINKKRFKEYKMSGIFTDDINVLKNIDENMEKSSDIIPVRIKRDESYYADVMAIDNKHFGELINYVSDMADKFKEEICEGNIDVNPIEKACTYCPYAGMCSFDVNAGDKYTEVPGYKLPEVISKLDEMYEDSEGEK